MSFVNLVIRACAGLDLEADPSTLAAVAELRDLYGKANLPGGNKKGGKGAVDANAGAVFKRVVELERIIAPFVAKRAASVIARVGPFGPKGKDALVVANKAIAASANAPGLSISSLEGRGVADIIRELDSTGQTKGVFGAVDPAYIGGHHHNRRNKAVFDIAPGDPSLRWTRGSRSTPAESLSIALPADKGQVREMANDPKDTFYHSMLHSSEASAVVAINSVRRGLGLDMLGTDERDHRNRVIIGFNDTWNPPLFSSGQHFAMSNDEDQLRFDSMRTLQSQSLAALLMILVDDEVRLIVDDFVEKTVGDHVRTSSDLMGIDRRHLSVDDTNRIAVSGAVLSRLIMESGPAAAHAFALAPMVGIKTFRDDTVGRFKQSLKARGLSDGGWKTLCKIPPRLSRNFTTSCEIVHSNEKKETTEAKNERMLVCLCHVLSLCASGGAAPEQSASLLSILFPAEHSKYCALGGSAGGWYAASRCVSNERRLAAFSAMRILSPDFSMERVANANEARAYLDESAARNSRQSTLVREMAARAALADNEDAQAALQAASSGSSPKGPFGFVRFEGELNRIRDFIQGSEMGLWQTFPEKLSYKNLLSRADEWHREIEAESVAKSEAAEAKALSKRLKEEKKLGRELSQNELDLLCASNGGWMSLVTKAQSDDLGAVALNSRQLLMEEGSAMHHCVSSYSTRCRGGDSRVFSIRRSGERLATAELGKTPTPGGPEQWSVVQIRGNCNGAIVDPAVLEFADQVASQYQAEHEKRLAIAREKAAAAVERARLEALGLALPDVGSKTPPKAGGKNGEKADSGQAPLNVAKASKADVEVVEGPAGAPLSSMAILAKRKAP